ncbi:MAG: hypothetical protein ACRC0S_09070 [Fusobacteriaceae bacterium]
MQITEDNIKYNEIFNEDTQGKFKYDNIKDYLNSEEYSDLGSTHRALFKKMIKINFDKRDVLEDIYFNEGSPLNKAYYSQYGGRGGIGYHGFLVAILKISNNREVFSFIKSNQEEMAWFSNLGDWKVRFSNSLESVGWNYSLGKEEFFNIKLKSREILIAIWVIFLILYFSTPKLVKASNVQQIRNAAVFAGMFYQSRFRTFDTYLKSKSKIRTSITVGLFIVFANIINLIWLIFDK